jgi:hypothetical protein
MCEIALKRLRAAQQTVEEMVRASVNIEPVRIGLARSVDCEHGSRMDLFLLHLPQTL